MRAWLFARIVVVPVCSALFLQCAFPKYGIGEGGGEGAGGLGGDSGDSEPGAGGSGSRAGAEGEDTESGGAEGDDGSGGDSASGGAPEATGGGAVSGDECATNGAIACVEAAHPERLRCEQHRWVQEESCGGSDLCDSQDGACRPIEPECESAQPGEVFCRNELLLSCGPDLVTTVLVEECSQGCEALAEPPRCTIPAVVQLSLGGGHACARFENGAVKCWGNNTSGQLGLEDAARRGDDLGEMGANLPVVDLGTGRTAKSITTGSEHTCALLDDDTVKCWGRNGNGQLGTGNTESIGSLLGSMGDALPVISLSETAVPIAIDAGNRHTCALLSDDTVKCWGENGSFGSLGVGDEEGRGDGPGEMGSALPAVNLGTNRSALAVEAGSLATCALLDDGTVKCWGENGFGGLGAGDKNNRGTTAAQMGDNLQAVDLGGAAAQVVRCGGNANCTLVASNVQCWGRNTFGQLGLGDAEDRGDEANELGDQLDPIDLGGLGVVQLSMSSAGLHACAVLTDGSLKCWGYNGSGALGLGDKENRGDGANEMGLFLPIVDLGSTAPIQSIVAGDYATCALFDDGRVKCWGSNGNGELGLGDKIARGEDPDQLGDALPFLSFW